MQMPLNPSWPDVALRLLSTVIASGIVGWNRGARGHSAGLRTTVLVSIAAALAMIEGNVLLGLEGRAPDSFASMDVMRLPLGILTGVGFIGGGAILKRGELVVGLTTAATLWVVTVLGLCFGGGLIGLGTVGAVLAVIVLWGFRALEARLPREHKAMLLLSIRDAASRDLEAALRARGFAVKPLMWRREAGGGTTTRLQLSWRSPEAHDPRPVIDTVLNDIGGVETSEVLLASRH